MLSLLTDEQLDALRSIIVEEQSLRLIEEARRMHTTAENVVISPHEYALSSPLPSSILINPSAHRDSLPRTTSMIRYELYQSNTTLQFLPETSSADTCSICLRPKSGLMRTVPCSHSFHRDCLDSWVETQRKNTCPLCRASIFTEPPRRRRSLRRYRNAESS